MRRSILPLVLALAVGCAASPSPTAPVDARAPYRRSDLPVDRRVADLVARMTVAEKARQLDMYFGAEDLLDKEQLLTRTHAKPDAPFSPERAAKAYGTLGIGSVHDLFPSPAYYNALQAWVIKSNRLGIPALFIEEGLHGYMQFDQTVFPQSVNLATTWDPGLAHETAAAIAAEARAHGTHMILGPVLDVARDPRWGRVEEDFGEDPYLSGQLGLAYVRGMQGDSLASDHTCIAEPKHFAAHGSPESGLNTAPVHAGEREMRSVMLKTFEPAFREGGAMSAMVAYHDVDGIPCTASPWLLNEVLRKEWGFRGFTLADLGAIRRLYDTHHVAATPAEAVRLALRSGMDMQFYDFGHDVFQNAIVEGVKEGSLSPAVLDAAVSRVLRVKFLLGLFDHPFVDEKLAAAVEHKPAHLETSLRVARESMCLLKNDRNLLPLSKSVKRIAVIGPNADVARLGDYADVAQVGPEFAMLAQIKKIVSPQTEVTFDRGDDVGAAAALAGKADVVILGLGEDDHISGEGHDRSSLDLPGQQEALLEAVAKTGVPVVLVLQNGRALTIPWAAEHVPAILEAWYPGELGGQAIAETLFGDNNPGGRLTVTFPKRLGQLPVYYNHFPSKNNHYIDDDARPQFPFGHGLSYTTFKYDRLAVVAPAPGKTEDLVATFTLTNTGSRAGDEVAQLYVRQPTTSVATPVKSLKAFSRVHLEAGETKTVTLRVRREELAVWGTSQTWKVEPGRLNITVGGSSEGGMASTCELK